MFVFSKTFSAVSTCTLIVLVGLSMSPHAATLPARQSNFPATQSTVVRLSAPPEAWFAQDENAPTSIIDFQESIKPLLSDRCFKCHGPDESQREAGLRLDQKDAVLAEAGSDDGIVVPGDRDASELFARISSDDESLHMPPLDSNLSLSAKEIELIGEWIDQGAKWQEHWSFAPLREVDPPAQETDWVRNEIDAFVLARMRERGLSPTPEADKSRWLRRLSFDLNGLPPSPEDLAAFLADDSPQSYERWVDEYLSRKAYGERMTADWLDVARYSDSFGYQVDRDRFVWPWRDWVIGAFNQNLPYDEFATWQLAGDLLPNATDEQILATTFCRLHGQKVEGGSVPEEFRNEYVADRNHTFATAFLGLTLECARCHDHKYDPITQREYYQLYAFFNNIDEAGLYSFFTSSVPTPTLMMTDDEQKQQLQNLRDAIKAQEEELTRIAESQRSAYDALPAADKRFAPPQLTAEQLPAPIKSISFEDLAAAPNELVAGVQGKAVKLTGDDGVSIGVGNFDNSQPFSIELWAKVPNHKERAVIFHRSRAWTDAGSRGYELLLIEGRLRWSLIHFWPGNAISIEAKEALPLQQWVHITVTYDGSSRASGLQLYVDGQLSETEVVRDHLLKTMQGGGGDNITIGERFRDRGFAKGEVDEFQVYDCQLTAAEVAVRYATIAQTLVDDQSPSFPELNEDDGFHRYLMREVGPYQEGLAELRKRRQALNQMLDGLQEIMVMRDMEQRRVTHWLHRGAYDAPRDAVEPMTPAALPAFPDEALRNRLGLAQWLTGPASALTARVAVNHYWQLIFGQGLVRTPEDFGSQGTPPTHPDLLDWLAADFIAHDWDVKRLLKKIVMSATYRQDSACAPETRQRDPENVWLARSPRYRLPAEMLRDQALQVSGLLVDKVGGPPAKPYEVTESFKPMNRDSGEGLYRRSVYTFWKRTGPAPVMMALDASKRDVCVVKRERTATPLQSLVLMNDPQFVEAAKHLAARLVEQHAEDRALLVALFQQLTSRMPDARELEILQRMLTEQEAQYEAEPEAAASFLTVGEKAVAAELPPARVAAVGVVAITLMNFDEVTMRR